MTKPHSVFWHGTYLFAFVWLSNFSPFVPFFQRLYGFVVLTSDNADGGGSGGIFGRS